MSSYESDINNRLKDKKELPERLHFSVLRYFWESSPLVGRRKGAIPYFLRKVDILRELSETELFTLSNYIHLRAFEEKESIFEQGDRGVGLYFVLSGEVAILVQDEKGEEREVVKIRRHDHFGELAFLQENHTRGAFAVALVPTVLVGLFRPDLEDLIYNDPIVGAKLLQSLALLLANRLASVTAELSVMKRQSELSVSGVYGKNS